MKFELVKNKVSSVRKGAFSSLLWERPVKTKKGCMDTITKRVRATVRFGIDYENMQSTKDIRATGKEAAGLQWGTWKQFPYFIEHTPKTSTIKQNYLRAYIGQGANIKTEYFLNGRKVDKSVIAPMCLASEIKEQESNRTITINIDNILAIG